ncbi:MAG: hypothetical protein ABL995_08600 [Bryobacteraceae bacterium]
MRFARIAAAFILLGAVLTPAKYTLRYLWGVSGREGILESLLAGLTYLLILMSSYAVVATVLWLARRLLVFADAWVGLGFADMDVGVRGGWPYRWFLLLGITLVVGATLGSHGEWINGLVEALAASTAVLLALVGPPPLPNPIDEYDPLPFPSPAPIPEPTPMPQPPSPADLIPLTMSWFFRKEPGALGLPATGYEIRVQASKSRYEMLLSKDHSVRAVGDYGRFVRDGLTPEIDETAHQLRQITERDRLHTISEINNVLALAQRFRYALDHEDKGVPEYPKYPLETMVEDRGDCEDHAIVAAACLVRLGYEVRLVSLEYGSGPGHMALAVGGADDLPNGFVLRDPISGQKFYYCEATTDAGSRDPHAVAFRMGEVPERDRHAKMELILLS